MDIANECRVCACQMLFYLSNILHRSQVYNFKTLDLVVYNDKNRIYQWMGLE